MAEADTSDLLETPLHALHVSLGGRMVPFAGYAMPVQFEGILAEHAQTRSAAGLFDVSHMGQAVLSGPDHETTARALETLLPSDIVGLKPGRMRYSLLLDDAGNILDDLIVTRPLEAGSDGRLLIVVNAARKHADYAYLRDNLPGSVSLEILDDRALLALQGPRAVDVLAPLASGVRDLTFMSAAGVTIGGVDCHVSRSGYTGEDGFEISVPAASATALAESLLAHEAARPIGLGARDTLRLEAGLCLYGHDIDDTTNPVEADLLFTLSKRRREAADFPGAGSILKMRENGPARRRVGLRLDGRAPAREGSEITDSDGTIVGKVTSGGFAPTVGAPIAMGYVAADKAAPDTALSCLVRSRSLPARISAMPFVPHNYIRTSR